MRLVMKSGENYCNLIVDKTEKIEDCLFAYRNGEFCGMFSLGCIDYIYISEEVKKC